MARLAGKAAVITGAASGTGEATARLFAEEGAAVLIADVQDDKGAAVVTEIEAAGGKSAYIHTDVSAGEDVQAMFRHAAELFGGIDVVYNNAGIGYNEGRIGDAAEEDFDRIIAIDLKGVWLGMKHCLPYLLERGDGVPVRPDDGAVDAHRPDHRAHRVAPGLHGGEQPLPGAVAPVAHEAVGHRLLGTVALGLVAPGGAAPHVKRAPGIRSIQIQRACQTAGQSMTEMMNDER